MGMRNEDEQAEVTLQQRLSNILREELLYGCTSVRDPRWPDRMARQLSSLLQDRFDILPKGELQEEWGVQITEGGKTVIETNPGAGEPLTREAAFYEIERWKSFGYITEGVMSRQATEWKRVDQ